MGQADSKQAAREILQRPGVANAVYMHDEKRWESATHFHEALEMLYVFKGRVQIEVEGAQYTAEGGDLAIYNRGARHREVFQEAEGGQETISLRVVDVSVRSLAAGNLLPAGVPPVLYTDGWQPEVEMCFRAIYGECLHQESGFSQIVGNLMQVIMLIVLRLTSDCEEACRGGVAELCRRVKQYIEHNYQRDILVRDIALAMGVSHGHLTHAFTRETGASPQQYLAMRRVGEAKRLLVLSGLQVRDIAAGVGYKSAARFHAQFKQLTGMTPSRYRAFKRGVEDHYTLPDEGGDGG